MDLKEMLSGLGYLVVGEAGNGRLAVNLARQLKPNLVIMDIKMPEMDGIEASRVLTQEKIAPVLLLTAYNQQELVSGAKEAGVIGYIVKPFRQEELMPAVEVTLSRFRELLKLEKEIGDLKETHGNPQSRRTSKRVSGGSIQSQGSRCFPPDSEAMHGYTQEHARD